MNPFEILAVLFAITIVTNLAIVFVVIRALQSKNILDKSQNVKEYVETTENLQQLEEIKKKFGDIDKAFDAYKDPEEVPEEEIPMFRNL